METKNEILDKSENTPGEIVDNGEKPSLKNKILSYTDILAGMSQEDYNDFVNETKRVRLSLFARDIFKP